MCGEVLEAVNDAVVALHERHHGRRPATARTRMRGGFSIMLVPEPPAVRRAFELMNTRATLRFVDG